MGAATWPGALSGAAAINREDLAGDPGGLRAGKEHGGGGDILCRAEAPRVDALDQTALAIGTVALPLPFARWIGAHEARRNGVAGYAARAKILAELLGQPDERVLGGGIGLDAGQARPQPGARRDENEASGSGPLHRLGRGLGEPERTIDVGL